MSTFLPIFRVQKRNSGSKKIRISKIIIITKFGFFFWENLDKNITKAFWLCLLAGRDCEQFLHISLLFRVLLEKGASLGPSPTHAAVQKWQQVLRQLFLKPTVPTANLLPKFAVWISHQTLHICSLHPHWNIYITRSPSGHLLRNKIHPVRTHGN